MELAFEEIRLARSKLKEPVSILLVVELAFEALLLSLLRTVQYRFNPSCSGIGF